MCGSMPFHVSKVLKHLQILVFVCVCTLEPISCEYQGTTLVKFMGSKSHTWGFDCVGVSTPISAVVQRSAVIGKKRGINSTRKIDGFSIRENVIKYN